MATQSLYRRYRPRRFSEVKGQDHVVRALRTAVAEGREGQAYLFSGPRGTGKTTSARILAKVLNCENPQDGEPCCECESCLAVERGVSYDVHELDAASNNGVDAMRDLIEKASLGTPGRHKVYILDEVHMLSRAAEAALLKTLEEPPPHVVFVLATTDPQKMSDTIRSRTQHLQFHLLPADTLAEHVRWVAADAGLDVSEAALEQALTRGGGSARDTLSALELVASTGDEGMDVVPLDEFVDAMIDRDSGRALTVVAHAISSGMDPRTLTEELIAFLRNGFLALMAPELVQVPSNRLDALASQAQRLGAAGLVRGIELLGAGLAEMRHAPDPRVLLDVATVQLTADSVSGDAAALLQRIERLERQVAAGATAPAVEKAPVPRDPATGRAALGGRARAEAPSAPTVEPTPAAEPAPAQVGEPAVEPDSAPVPAEVPAPAASPVAAAIATMITADVWENTIRPALRGMARAVYAPAEFVRSTESALTLSVPNAVHRAKCEEQRSIVESALAAFAGVPVAVEFADDVDGGSGSGAGSPSRPAADTSATPPATSEPDQTASRVRDEVTEPVQSSARERGLAAAAAGIDADGSSLTEFSVSSAELPDDDDVDLDDLVDAPPESVKSPIDRLAEAFPGSELIEEAG
ncbi:MAG TPA: DNA polymerase III subunit gamma/tau [Ilumatobacteraceae bacterium]|jgi:DNA polymerase-3 subunit gamma/tau|nr:DNA polymerase III subunit gamma/tau [Ilumatobacteraceae bacterium]